MPAEEMVDQMRLLKCSNRAIEALEASDFQMASYVTSNDVLEVSFKATFRY